MPSARSNTGARTTPGEAKSRPISGVLKSASRARHDPVASEYPTGSLVELSSRSAAALADALDQLISVQEELRSVVDIIAERPWSEEERALYRALARQERKIHRRCVAVRDWFDDIGARDYESASYGALSTRRSTETT
jgi:hypothetical protein